MHDNTLTLACPAGGWPPFIFCDEANPKGIYIDVLKEITLSLNMQLAVKQFPEKRIFSMLRSGEVDVYTKARAWVSNPDSYLWSIPLFDNEDVIMSRKDAPVQFRAIGDLAGLRIGTVLGFAYPTLKPLYDTGGLKPRDAPDSLALIRKLHLGRYDGVVVNEHIARHLVRTSPDLDLKDFVFSTEAVDRQPIRLVLPGNAEAREMLPRINALIERMHANGFITRTVQFYCGPDAH